MNKKELAAAMYETMLELGRKQNLGFDRVPPTFKLLHEPEHSKWEQWAEAIIARVAPNNVTNII
jgi:hypothetical protein